MPDFASAPSLASLAASEWDLLVIGGGITGAGILREAARAGLRALLVEQRDFASGTSSRSSKLIHGGLHYMSRLQIKLARDAIHERDRMVRAGAGLVERMDFVLPELGGHRLPARFLGVGLSAYDLLAGQLRLHRRLDRAWVERHVPGLTAPSAFRYSDAATDDARLVLRVLQEACRLGAQAVNYVAVTELLRDEAGEVVGACLHDHEHATHTAVRARVVVNATGPWADRLRGQLGAPTRLRLLRGSHIILPARRLPLTQAIACLHPESRQPMYCVPWEGVVLVGATNVDHSGSVDDEPRISADETAYLLRGLQSLFPALGVGRGDILSTFAGLRPLVDWQTADAAKASREHAIWSERGLLTVAGGKLTTFRIMAQEALQKLRTRLPHLKHVGLQAPILDAAQMLPPDLPLAPAVARRVLARYGSEALAAVAGGSPSERKSLPGRDTLWAEFRWAARMERVRHLDDLLLRRVRLGLTAPFGGLAFVETLRGIIQPELGWSDDQWQAEVETYQVIWERAHGVPSF
jgi:glycerol-3-phosphate dehydrogenase